MKATRHLTVVAGQTQTVQIELVPPPDVEEEVTVVASTRTGRRLEDQPMRVEVLGREEIEEKMLMTPGDIVMMLNEMGGLRVQATSPSLGAASVRIQGMRGRYTRFLSDGLPLFGEQPGGLGLLQIPPMDLGQVEVIKGVASALYGAGAMGGVVNLLSRRPGDDAAHEVLFNQSTRGATDARRCGCPTPLDGAAWGGSRCSRAATGRAQVDVDDDGWADLARYTRGVVRPRVFWDERRGRVVLRHRRAHLGERGAAARCRTRRSAATGLPYRESLDTTRVDGGVLGQMLVGGTYVLTARAAAAHSSTIISFGETLERDQHDTAVAEVAIRGAARACTRGWPARRSSTTPTTPRDVPRFGYTFTTPGALRAGRRRRIRPWLLVSASGRVDWHSEYGTFFSPRGSVLLRGGGWTSRVSAGQGFFAPTPLTEETEAAGLTRLTCRRRSTPNAAAASRSISAGRSAPLSFTFTAFASHVVRSRARRSRDDLRAQNLDGGRRPIAASSCSPPTGTSRSR